MEELTQEVLEPEVTSEPTPTEAVETPAAVSAPEEKPAEEAEEEVLSPIDGKPIQQKKSKKDVIIDEVKRSRDDWREISNRQFKELEELRKALETARTQTQAAPKPKEELVKPKQDDFPNYDDYVEALTDYKAAKHVEKVREEQRVIEEKRTQEDTMRQRRDRLQDAQKKYQEVQEILSDQNYPISPVMADAVLDSPNAPELLRYFAMHREEAQKVHGMSPISAIRAIGRIEAQIEQSYQRKPTTKAPEPITPVAGSASSVGAKTPEEMTATEYMAWRDQQEFGRKKT